jgi:tRNA modification GTPase
MSRTIYALSSGRPPAAIAVVRVSGPAARVAGIALAGTLPRPRYAALRRLRDAEGATLDQALVLFFPGPDTATGEDLLEFHLHGGRAVVAAVERALSNQPGLSLAEPGEFTRQSLINGRLDLAQTEGLADLLEAETELQRRAALTVADGTVSRHVEGWLDQVSAIAARIEAELDFGDEGDVSDAAVFDARCALRPLLDDIANMLSRPPVERLRDGTNVVIAGPRNAGKSSLFNALLGRDAAIVTDIAGTTRDVLEAQVIREGLPFRLVDTAGLTDETADPIEAIGILKARDLLALADVILWLGDPAEAPGAAITVAARADERDRAPLGADVSTSIHDFASIDRLWDLLTRHARSSLDPADLPLLRKRQRSIMAQAVVELEEVRGVDLLLDAEHLRIANAHLGSILGRDATEAMLDALFGRFCLGK